MHHQTDHRQDNENCKDARNIHAEIQRNNEVSQPNLGTDELSHDRSNNCEYGGNLETGEYKNESGWNSQPEEGLPFGCAERLHHVQLIFVCGMKSGDNTDKNRKETNQRRNHDFRGQAVTKPDDKQRSDRDLWKSLKGHQIWIDQPLESRNERYHG